MQATKQNSDKHICGAQATGVALSPSKLCASWSMLGGFSYSGYVCAVTVTMLGDFHSTMLGDFHSEKVHVPGLIGPDRSCPTDWSRPTLSCHDRRHRDQVPSPVTSRRRTSPGPAPAVTAAAGEVAETAAGPRGGSGRNGGPGAERPATSIFATSIYAPRRREAAAAAAAAAGGRRAERPQASIFGVEFGGASDSDPRIGG